MQEEISYTEFMQILSQSNQNTRQEGFCKEVTVTVEMWFATLETTMYFCCSSDIGGSGLAGCAWVTGNDDTSGNTERNTDDEIDFSSLESFTILSSSEMVIDNYSYSIKLGEYHVDSETGEPNFVFIQTEL